MESIRNNNIYRINIILINIISMLIIAICSVLVFLDTRPQKLNKLLTHGEKEWLTNNRNTIIIGFLEQDFPFEFIESERPGGSYYDIISLLEKNLNVRFQIIYYPNQSERYKAIREGGIDFYLGRSAMAHEGELKTYPVYKIPVISLKLKERKSSISRPPKAGICPASPAYKVIAKNPDFPDILIYNSENFGYSALAEEEIDYFISDLVSYYFFINNYKGPEIKINHVYRENIEINAFVNSQNHWLFSILEKVSAIALQKSEDWNQRIYNQNLSLSTFPINLNRISLNIFLSALLFSIINLIFLILHKKILLDEPDKKITNLQHTILNGIELMNAAFILTDENGFIQYCNNEAEKLISNEIREYLTHPFDNIFHFFNSTGRIESPLRKTIDTMTPRQLPFQSFMFNKNNEKFWISDIFCPLSDNKNEITGICIIIHNNSEKNEKEQEILIKEKMETISRMTGKITSVLNKKTADIRDQIKQMAAESPVDFSDETTKSIRKNIKEIDRNTKLLDSFLQTDELKKSRINIHKIILSIREQSLCNVEKINIETTLQAISDCVAGNEEAISRLIENLVKNAIEAIYPAKGHILITTENIKLSLNYCKESSFDLSPGDYVLIRIIDSGRGIAPEIRSSIFEPFFTTKNNTDNPGLGLSIAYQTIVNHSGAIFSYSDKNEGSEFHIFLPVCHEQQKIPAPQENLLSSKGPILVIDDEPVVRDLTKTLLNDMGLDVLTARDGEEGEKVFRLHKDKIKLILLDMIMPNRSGWETFPVLKSINDQVPIVIASGFSISSNMNEILESGGAGFLRKPYRKQELIEILNKHLPD